MRHAERATDTGPGTQWPSSMIARRNSRRATGTTRNCSSRSRRGVTGCSGCGRPAAWGSRAMPPTITPRASSRRSSTAAIPTSSTRSAPISTAKVKTARPRKSSSTSTTWRSRPSSRSCRSRARGRAMRRKKLNRAGALDRDAVARAGVRPVIPHRVMLDTAIVPECDRVLLPAKAALEERVRHVLVQIAQHAVALVARQAVDVARKALVDVERLPAGHRMGAHDGVVGGGIALLILDTEILVLPAIVLAVMPSGETFEILLQAVAKRLVGRVHVREQRVAAARRAFPDVEDRAHRRLGIARHVRVPALAIGAEGLLVGVDDHQFRMARL